MLNASATKRDTKTYLARFKPKPQSKHPRGQETSLANEQQRKQDGSVSLEKVGVNLGRLYSARAIDESPVFTQDLRPQQLAHDSTPQIHLALVKVRVDRGISETTLDGIGLTLAQLSRLGLQSVVVVDCKTEWKQGNDNHGIYKLRTTATEYAEQLVKAIQAHHGPGARVVESALGCSSPDGQRSAMVHSEGDVHVQMKSVLLSPLKKA